MLRRQAGWLFVCAVCLALPSGAAAGWSPPESTGAGAPSPLTLAQTGTGLVFRYSATSQPTIAERPPGGPLGPPDVLTGTIGTNDYPILAVDGSGNALLASHADHQIAYRPA